MNNYKKEILEKICYTDLVYGRINKKLNINLSNQKIEELILSIISETDEDKFIKTGKNIYIASIKKNIRLTINSYTNRIITADILNKKTNKEKKNNEQLTAVTQYTRLLWNYRFARRFR